MNSNLVSKTAWLYVYCASRPELLWNTSMFRLLSISSIHVELFRPVRYRYTTLHKPQHLSRNYQEIASQSLCLLVYMFGDKCHNQFQINSNIPHNLCPLHTISIESDLQAPNFHNPNPFIPPIAV